MNLVAKVNKIGKRILKFDDLASVLPFTNVYLLTPEYP